MAILEIVFCLKEHKDDMNLANDYSLARVEKG